MSGGFKFVGFINEPDYSTSADGFRLANDKPKPKPVRPENVPTRQRPLFSGLDK